MWHFISESAGFQTGQKDKRRIHLSITYHMTNIYKHWKNGKHRKKIAHYFFVFVHNSFWNYFFVMIKKHICTTNCIFFCQMKTWKKLRKKIATEEREKNSLKRHRYTKERKPLNCLHVALITQKNYKFWACFKLMPKF